jgi:hypothetical protein
MGRKPKEQTPTLDISDNSSTLGDHKEQEFFLNYFKYVKSMIPELNNGKISEA